MDNNGVAVSFLERNTNKTGSYTPPYKLFKAV